MGGEGLVCFSIFGQVSIADSTVVRVEGQGQILYCGVISHIKYSAQLFSLDLSTSALCCVDERRCMLSNRLPA